MSQRRGGAAFVCQECGAASPKWLGRCPECGQWNSFVQVAASPRQGAAAPGPLPLSEVDAGALTRLVLPMGEVNRVLGGGIVPGSLVLLSGDPGVGKSTLLLQIASLVAQAGGPTLYVSGEESIQQIKLRARRLGVAEEGLLAMATTDLEQVLQSIAALRPRMVVVDSIQTMSLEGMAAGSIAQIRSCTLGLLRCAKETHCPIFLVGHVTKDGSIAGPRALEHMVDVVLYFEGERFSAYRILRGVKNRFGPTDEVGVFEMGSQGLAEVENPSAAFLAERAAGAVGSAIVSVMEGTRPLLVEVQALTSPTAFGQPRRTANGIDYNRLLLLVAVLTQRAGLPLAQQDVMVNVVGGLQVEEPAADLGTALAIASSLRGRPVREDAVFVGEVGLSGEIRGVPQLERRVAEAARLGFGAAIVPRRRGASTDAELELLAVGNLAEALRLGLA